MIEAGDRVTPPRRHDDSCDIYVDHALDVIRCQYATVKIRDIARHIGINRSYLTNIFKKRTGLSPQEYLLRYRLNIACRLLLTTNYPIQEVARQIGYGVSPKVYRSQGTLPPPEPVADTDRKEPATDTDRKQSTDTGREET